MSNEARQWAWSLPDLPTPVRLLLVALAEHVRDGTTCFPGQTRLAAMCGISERQVRHLMMRGDLKEGLHWFKKSSRMVLLSVQALEEWIKED